MEINPRHPIIKELLQRVQNGDKETASVTADVLYETAILSSGYAVDDPTSFAKIIHKMMSLNLNLAESELVDVPEEPEEDYGN